MGGSSLNPLVILGATGSIGRQTVEVAARIGAPIHTIAARTPSDDLLELARQLPDAEVCITEPGQDKSRFVDSIGDRLHLGPGAITEAAAVKGVTVVNGVVGSVGLAASLATLYAGNRLALANKESLVAGGPLIREALDSSDGELIPVDSEHSAVWQCVVGEPVASVERVVLTASGGPFRGRSTEELANVSVAEALVHPTWSMGPRITTDSATLMNKAFEVIEAHYLFDLSYDQVDVVVHPQSVVHSFVEFEDGVVKAEVGFPDMRKPIQYAITYPDRVAVEHRPFDIAGTDLTFEAPDVATFPCLELGYSAGRTGGTATAVLNAADEIAVAAFLDGEIPFLSIHDVVSDVLEQHQAFAPSSIDDIRSVDTEARAKAREVCQRIRVD